MTDTAAHDNRIVVMGDLCVDVLIDCSYASPFIQHGPVEESSLRSSNSLSVGGSAWLLALAAKDTGFFVPLILSAVGNDAWADQLVTAVRAEGFPVESIQRTDATSTDLVCMITMPGHARLMFMPMEPTNNRLNEGFVLNFLRNTDPSLIKWTWVSGYALVDRSSTRRQAARLLADWSRGDRIPVVLDLVPHEFDTAVGTLDEVVSFLGAPDALIGAPSTFRGFGYAYDENSNDPVTGMRQLATQASQDWGIVITQAHIGPEKFGQVVARDGTVISVDELVMPPHDVRGTGDRLAVEALHHLC